MIFVGMASFSVAFEASKAHISLQTSILTNLKRKAIGRVSCFLDLLEH